MPQQPSSKPSSPASSAVAQRPTRGGIRGGSRVSPRLHLAPAAVSAVIPPANNLSASVATSASVIVVPETPPPATPAVPFSPSALGSSTTASLSVAAGSSLAPPPHPTAPLASEDDVPVVRTVVAALDVLAAAGSASLPSSSAVEPPLVPATPSSRPPISSRATPIALPTDLPATDQPAAISLATSAPLIAPATMVLAPPAQPLPLSVDVSSPLATQKVGILRASRNPDGTFALDDDGDELRPRYPEGFRALPPFEIGKGRSGAAATDHSGPRRGGVLLLPGVFCFSLPDGATFNSRASLDETLGPRREIFLQLWEQLTGADVGGHLLTSAEALAITQKTDLNTVTSSGRRYLHIALPDLAPSIAAFTFYLQGHRLDYVDCGPSVRKNHITIALQAVPVSATVSDVLDCFHLSALHASGQVLEVWQVYDYGQAPPAGTSTDLLPKFPSVWWQILFALEDTHGRPIHALEPVLRDWPGWIPSRFGDLRVVYLFRFPFCGKCRLADNGKRHLSRHCMSIVCRNCGEKGHVFRRCPHPPSGSVIQRGDVEPMGAADVEPGA